VLADLADLSSHPTLVDAAWTWRGGVDVWINNAGADVLTGESAGVSFEEKLDRLWRVDVLATIRLSRLAGARMRRHASRAGQAVILNLGWDQAEHGMGGDSGEMFGAVKGAVMAFTRSLACSLAPEVRVNCLAPGWIKTAWGEHASEYWQERAQDESLLQRWGTPEDVAHVARFLASPAAEFISGQVIPVNGGLRRSGSAGSGMAKR
jgi:3-oxoacyl-[acyl-carrier protein] reductase